MEGRGAKNATMAFFKLPPSPPEPMLVRVLRLCLRGLLIFFTNHNVQKDNQPQYIHKYPNFIQI
jgi:hypothetical protein